MVENEVCTSCKTNIANLKGSVEFSCPNCNKSKIVRCFKCRELGSKYVCLSCGFSGPN
ncbi:RNA-binding protein [Candidatus Woesearchaeota archaeon]|nr:RNA-binding protein [Candidatus Woesearchaeota archaeon]